MVQCTRHVPSTVVLYCWCHSDSASVLLYFTHMLPDYVGLSVKISRCRHLQKNHCKLIGKFIKATVIIIYFNKNKSYA